MSVFNKTVSNTFYMVLVWGTLTLTSFFFQLLSIKYLTQEDFGISLTAINFSVFISSIVILGFNIAIAKLIPEYIRKKKHERARNIVSRSFIIILISSFIVSAIILINFKQISILLKMPVSVLILSVISMFFYSLAIFFGNIVYGMQNMKRYFISGSAFGISKLIISFLLILLGFRYFGPIVGFLIGNIIWLALLFTPKMITFKIKKFNDRKLFEYSVPGLLSTFSNSLFTNAQYIILSIIKTVKITGVFGVGMLISSVVAVIPNILSLSIFPILSELSVGGRKSQSLRLLKYTIKYSLFFTIPIIFIFSIFSNTIILLFANENYVNAKYIIPIISVSSLIMSLASGMNNAIYAAKKPITYKYILLLVSSIFLIITPVLSYLKGDIGISIGFFVTMVIFFIISFINLRKTIKLEFPSINLLKILLASFLVFVPWTFFVSYVNNIISLIIVSLISLVLYVLLLVLLKFYENDDKRIIKSFLNKMRINNFDKIIDRI